MPNQLAYIYRLTVSKFVNLLNSLLERRHGDLIEMGRKMSQMSSCHTIAKMIYFIELVI